MVRRALQAFTALLLAALVRPAPAHGQQPGVGWSPPEMIAETEGRLASTCMALVADGWGGLHLFYPQRDEEGQSGAINYLHWDGEAWSEPVDILVDPSGGDPACPRAAIDGGGLVHLIWIGQGHRLEYTVAPASRAGSVWSWSKPWELGLASGEPDLVLGPDGTLYVAYVYYPPTGILALIRSADGGETWSDEVVIASAGSGQSQPGEVRLAVDGGGRLHAAWTEYELPDGWPPTGAFYSRSLDGGVTWESPLRVATPDHAEIGVGVIGSDEVHLVWRSTIGGDGTFHQVSTDGGATWEVPTRYDDRGGLSGLPSFAVDSAQGLHFVTGAVTYGWWQAGRSGAYEDLKTDQVRAQAKESAGERGMLAATLGNRLHVVFESDFDRLWYTTKQLGLAPQPTSTSMASPERPPATPTPLPDPTAAAGVPTPAATVDLSTPLGLPSSGTPGAVVGALAAAAMVLLIVAINTIRGKRL